MTARTKTPSVKAPFVTALTVLVMLLATGPVDALYPPNGSKPDGAGGHMNPDDGMCVIGVAADGTMLVDWSITNARDCVAYTTGLTGMTTQAACTNAGGAGNDGYRHTWVTSNTCVDAANPAVAISLVGLDRTVAMCRSKGGTTLTTTGTCVAYGWVYRNRKADGPPPTLPISGTGISTTDGVQSTDNLGFCYTGIRMTGGAYTSATCPSYHNSPVTTPGEWPACLSSTTGCQTPASYDAGLGWTFAGSNCVYAFGLNGTLNANVTNAAGTVTASGTAVDLTGILNQGDCLAAGYSWDNWLPSAGTTIKTHADGGDYAGMPAGAQIRKLDALTPVEGGGGEFYSGTGFNCLKCHSDQSRAYQERNKPGFTKTRHQKAGDDLSKPFSGYFTAGSSDWGLQGVICSMCHSTAKPARDDLIQVVPKGVVGPPAEGNPKSATGHNQTEYGAHLLDVCYTCHGSAANPPTTNPASVIPVSGGDFALTSNLPGPSTSNLSTPPQTAGLAPIVNQFLNSPHAEYGLGTGDPTSLKIDIGDRRNYGSSFEGYVCRTAATTVSGSLAPGGTWNVGNCGPAGHSWVQPAGATAFGCYWDSDSCPAAGNTWNAVFDAVQYPVNNGGVCSGVGLGSIITTVYRNGSAQKIHNLDSATNDMCTNPGDGNATSGAGGYWVRDGETSPGGTPNATDQGNCMTCHDVHWALADTAPEAESFRRECPTCHVNPGTSASGAPQIDLSTINHLKTAGTPLENWLTDPFEACVTCHMPKSSATGSPMHLWRINTDATYETMGATQANLAPDGDYPDAAWVDLDRACGQCHGGDSGAAKPGVPYYSKAQLAQVAEGMHGSAGVSYPVTFSYAVNGLTVTVDASVNCGGPCPALTYDWDWGDGSAHGTLDPDNHTFASGGAKSVTLTVRKDGKKVGSVTRSITLANPDLAPTVAGTCTWNANTWKMTVADSSSDDGPDADTVAGDGNPTLKIAVKWGDSSTNTNTTQGASVNHTYLVKGTYTVTQTAIDAKLQKAVRNCETGAVTAAPFQITGLVQAPSGTPVAYATVRLMKGTTVVKSVYTASNGTFALTNLNPFAYTLRVTKTGYTFPAASAITVGPNSLGNVIIGTKP